MRIILRGRVRESVIFITRAPYRKRQKISRRTEGEDFPLQGKIKPGSERGGDIRHARGRKNKEDYDLTGGESASDQTIPVGKVGG